MAFVKNVSQGRTVNEQEHQQLLERMNAFQQQKKVTYVKGATVEQVLKELENCDEVVYKLKDGSILRIKENQIWMNGILAFSINPTSDETGATYEQGIHKSNNYTGKQHFEQILEKYLD